LRMASKGKKKRRKRRSSQDRPAGERKENANDQPSPSPSPGKRGGGKKKDSLGEAFYRAKGKREKKNRTKREIGWVVETILRQKKNQKNYPETPACLVRGGGGGALPLTLGGEKNKPPEHV